MSYYVTPSGWYCAYSMRDIASFAMTQLVMIRTSNSYTITVSYFKG